MQSIHGNHSLYTIAITSMHACIEACIVWLKTILHAHNGVFSLKLFRVFRVFRG